MEQEQIGFLSKMVLMYQIQEQILVILFNMQKAIDAQTRSHLDSLALTTSPMIAMDATRLPRGMKFEIKPGKAILTNGAPSEILYPFKFGQSDPNNLATAKEFERMLLQATGTLDSQGLVSQSSRDGGGMSMAVSRSCNPAYSEVAGP